MPTCPEITLMIMVLLWAKLADLGLNKYKLFNSWEEYGEAALQNLKKLLKKCLKF